jgi:hypothetical protein
MHVALERNPLCRRLLMHAVLKLLFWVCSSLFLVILSPTSALTAPRTHTLHLVLKCPATYRVARHFKDKSRMSARLVVRTVNRLSTVRLFSKEYLESLTTYFDRKMPSVEPFRMCVDNAAFEGTIVWRRNRGFVGQIGSSRVKFYADQCPVFSSEGRSTGLQRVFRQINGLVRAMRYRALNACNCKGELIRSGVKL